MRMLFVRPNAEIHMVPPPMGLLYLSSCLRQSGEHESKIIDGRLLKLNPDEIIEMAREYDPDIVGITGLTMEGPAAHQIASLAKQQWPERPVVLGGPYATSEPQKSISDPNVDFCFYGESERSFQEWINAQVSGTDVSTIPGLGYRVNGLVKSSVNCSYIDNLDEIPFPAWDQIELERYFNPRFLHVPSMNPHPWGKRIVPIVTTRGCPYRCTYCHNIFGKRVRKRSVGNVIEEMKLLKRCYDIEEIEFIDDIFNVDIERAKSIFREVIDLKLNLKFSFPNGLRSDSFDEELLDLMKSAGAYRLMFAVESGSQRIQKVIRKNLNLEKAQANITLANKKGFFVGGFFIIGFPDETEEEMRQSIDFALKSKLHTANFVIVTPFPGTELWKQAMAAGVPVEKAITHFYQVSINLSKVPSKRLDTLRRLALARFYLNPVRILRFISRVPNFPRRSLELGVILMLTLIGKWKN
ncbi:MAG: radical SAM protein [bacterium]|nr:radical SAM protein [bacterium]